MRIKKIVNEISTGALKEFLICLIYENLSKKEEKIISGCDLFTDHLGITSAIEM